MDRVKIQEIATEAGASNAVLLEKAKELGYDVKAANSTITVDEAGILIDYTINGIKPKPKIAKKVKIIKTENSIKYWLIPSNPKNFDAIKELRNGRVWWSKKLKNMSVNDIVYIYITKPIQKIAIKAVIVEIDDIEKLFTIELVKYLDYTKSDKFSYETLLSKGFVKGSIQNKSQIKNDEFLKYILDNEKKVKRSKKGIMSENFIESEQQCVMEENRQEEMLIDRHIESEQQKVLPQKNMINKKSNHDTLILNEKKQKFSNKKIGNLKFKYKNILLKGVPGTGKSRTLENIINNHLNLKEHYDTNVLRINIHSASSNADLMQGIAINSNSEGDIEYKEKQGLILEFIERATFHPHQPFVLVLEEIQENSLNELIGDLIYLVEDSKRADKYVADDKEYAYSELVTEIMKQNSKIDSVKLPSLINKQEKIKQMIIPHNLFIFCTSNYRDDRKVIEDNLLRRFDVIEIYPKSREEIGKDEDGDFIFRNENTSDFLEALNKSIIELCRTNGEIHPDRFMIGHSIWLKVEDKKAFSRAFLKVITEFKDVKDMYFDDFKKITDKLDFPFELEKEYESYEEWIKVLQKESYSFLSDN